MTDVLLVEPPAMTGFGSLRLLGSIGTFKAEMAWPPLDLMIISGLLAKHGIDSTIYDANTLRASFEDVKKKVLDVRPRMVIFTTSTTSILHDIKTAETVKQASSDVLTVAIGTHIMALPEETIKESKYLDICVHSEPELPILDLVKAGYKPDDVLGLTYRRGGHIIRNTSHPGTEDMDVLGYPSHDKISLELYHDPLMKRTPFTITYGQRGCINRCTYCCSTFYGKLRHRSVPHLMGELRWIVELGIREVKFFDLGFSNDPAWAHRLLDTMIEEKIDVTWTCNCRSDRLPDDILKKMKRAGCHSISIGGESGDPTVLRTVEKNVTPEVIKDAVIRTRRAGINPMVYFMLGLPGETKESMKKTIEFAKEIDPDIITLGIATPHPGTKFYKFIKENNYLQTDDWSQYDPNKKPVFSYPELSSEEIYEVMRQGYQSFYLRPSYILRRMSSIRTPLDLKNNVKNFVGFVQRYVIG